MCRHKDDGGNEHRSTTATPRRSHIDPWQWVQLDAQVGSLPALWGEKPVLRLVPANSRLLTLHALSLNQTQLAHSLKALSQPQGLILVTGPPDSAKTQTLYTALQWLNAEDRNISIAGEPIEIPLTGINRVAIRPSIGLDFAATLRARYIGISPKHASMNAGTSLALDLAPAWSADLIRQCRANVPQLDCVNWCGYAGIGGPSICRRCQSQ